MTDPGHHHDARHAAEEPGVLSEYGNDTGFAEDLLDEEAAPAEELPDENTPLAD
jgi:hypothetical protein